MTEEQKKYYEEKKQEVIEVLKPFADVLDIKIDYVAEVYEKENDKSFREYLICDNQKICVNATSIYGIEEEFWGYVFLLKSKDRCYGKFDTQFRNEIKRYWYDDNFKQPYNKTR